MKPSSLSLWQPRPLEFLLAGAARHTRFVTLSKAILWGAALALVGSVVALPLLTDQQDAFRLVGATLRPGDAADPKMEKPHFHGLDKHNRPYNLTATEATPLAGGAIRLNTLEADLALAGDAWVSANATLGVLDMAAKTLALNGQIEVFHNSGYEVRTISATIDLGKGTAQGDTPVQAQGPAGYLQASGFEVTDQGDALRFRGPVRVRLYPQAER